MVGPETKTRLERNPEPLSNFLDRKLRFYANVCCEIEVEGCRYLVYVLSYLHA